jgi:hypothetical protein
MTSPKPQTRRDFMPAPVRHLDGVLLRRYPLLWSSRLHLNIPIAMGLLILASTFGWALKTEQLAIQDSITVGLLFVLPWFVIVFRQERTLPEAAARMPERSPEAYARLLLLLLWSSIVSYTPVAFAASVDSAQRSSAVFEPMSAAVVWTAALMFMSPNLIWGLPMLLYIAILVLEAVGFLI